MYAMCPLRPTAMATPGATASSIAVLTTLSSLPRSAVSSPELLRPTSGSRYLIGGGAAAAILAVGGGAHALTATRATTKTKDFIYNADCGLRWVFSFKDRADCGLKRVPWR